jgi:hypothetical protein
VSERAKTGAAGISGLPTVSVSAEVPPRGNAHPAKTQGKSGISSGQRAKSSAVEPETPPIDPDLRAIIEQWPDLPEAVKANILAMVQASGK